MVRLTAGLLIRAPSLAHRGRSERSPERTRRGTYRQECSTSCDARDRRPEELPQAGHNLSCGIPPLGAEHIVGPALIPDHVVGVVGRGVFRRLVRSHTGWHGGPRAGGVAVAEK